MKSILLFVILSFSSTLQDNDRLSRIKREATGALEILTNNAQPIHADVKIENGQEPEKPCKHTYKYRPPSHIESGAVFQVIPPQDALYEPKSLRKSLPVFNKLDLIRGINRVVTLSVVFVSIAMEIYPILCYLYEILYEYIYFNKY